MNISRVAILLACIFLQTFKCQVKLCVRNLINQLIIKEDKLLFVYSNFEQDYVNDILKHLKSVVLVNVNNEGNLESLEDTNFYLFFLENITNFNKFLDRLHRIRGWNPRRKILVFNVKNEELHGYFKTGCRYLLSNLALVDVNFNIFNFEPFGENSSNCYKAWKLGRRSNFPFANKTIKTYNGCPLKILPLVIPPFVINTISEKKPGFEILILREAALRLNLTIRYIENPYKTWGNKLSNGTVTDMYSVLASRKADVIVGMVVAKENLINDFDSVIAHVQVYLTFHVPSALSLEPWENLTLVFTKTIWILILGSFILTSAVFWLAGSQKNLTASIFLTLEIFLSSSKFVPKQPFLCFIFILWNFYCFLIVSMYHSNLISFLTKPAQHHQISTVEELVDSDLDYGGYKLELRPLFFEPNNPTFMKIYNNLKDCPLTEECINKSAHQRNFGVLKTIRQVNFLMSKYYTFPNGKKMLYQFKQPISRFYSSFVFTKGFPLYKSFEKLVLLMRENGLVDKWDKEQSNAQTYQSNNSDSEPRVLSMYYLKVSFVVLICGHGISLVFFITELVVRRFKFK